MKYSLLAYKYFIDVVETQGFTPAAKRNFVSQTAISNAVKNLEKELNVQLIDRSTSHFRVTLPGVNLYHFAIPLLKQYYEFNQKAGHLDNAHRSLHIRYLRGFDHWAIKLAQSLKKDNPELQLHLDTERFSDSIPRLDVGDYDALIGFSTAVSKIKSIHKKTIGTANFGLLLNQAMFDKQGQVNQELIKQQPLFLQKWSATDSNDVQTKIKQILHTMAIDHQKIIYRSSFSAALANVILNQGIALYPKELSIPRIYESQVRYLPDLPPLQYDVVAIYKNPIFGDLLCKSMPPQKS